MIFNGHDFRDLLVVEKIERSFLPPLQNYSKQVPGKTGFYFTRNEIGVGLIKVSVRLIEKNRLEVQERVREIAGKLFTNKPAKLVLRDDNRYDIAIVSGSSPIEKFLYTGYGQIEFECFESLSYGSRKTYKVDQEFDNNGTASTSAVFNLVAKTGEKIAVKANNDTHVTIIYPFKGSEKVIVDMGKENVTINGKNSLKYLSLESDFFKIPPGTKQRLIIEGAEGTIEFIERWF